MQKNFKTSDEVFEYIQSFYNLEQAGVYNERTYRLDRIKLLLSKLKNPHLEIKAVHIAGSKGKGSTAKFTAEILKQAGYKVGLFASPHLYSYHERITLAGDFFPEAGYIEAGEELARAVNLLNKDIVPTVFELLTAMFFIMTRLHNCDLAVIETGLGGRLDATNICQPIATIITNIELEHTDFLGNSIEDIAREKAGIIKKNISVFTQAEGRALKVIKEIAKENKSKVFLINKNSVSKKDKNLIRKIKLYNGEKLNIKLNIAGEIQALNFATAANACKFLDKNQVLNIPNQAIIAAAENVILKGRFEVLSQHPLLILDCSHTPKSIKHFFTTLKKEYPEKKFITIFGSASDKNHKKMLRTINKYSRKIILTKPGNFKTSNIEELYEKYKKPYRKKLILEMQAKNALELCKNDLNKDKDIGIIVTGSFYLAQEIAGWEEILLN